MWPGVGFDKTEECGEMVRNFIAEVGSSSFYFY